MSNERKTGRVIGGMSGTQTSKQLGILILDGSGSMEDEITLNRTKAQDVDDAVKELIDTLKNSTNKANFYLAAVAFDRNTKIILNTTHVPSLNANASYNPTVGLGGETSIYEGLVAANKIADDFLKGETEGGLEHSVVFIVMSDGIDMTPEKTIPYAENLNSQFPKKQIASAYYCKLGETEKEAEETLIKIAFNDSDKGKRFKQPKSGMELRLFLKESMGMANR